MIRSLKRSNIAQIHHKGETLQYVCARVRVSARYYVEVRAVFNWCSKQFSKLCFKRTSKTQDKILNIHRNYLLTDSKTAAVCRYASFRNPTNEDIWTTIWQFKNTLPMNKLWKIHHKVHWSPKLQIIKFHTRQQKQLQHFSQLHYINHNMGSSTEFPLTAAGYKSEGTRSKKLAA